MAGDGRMCSGDVIVNDETEKVFHAKDGSAVGCAGDAAIIELVRKWFEDGEDVSLVPRIDVTADDPDPVSVLILRPDGRVQWMNHRFAPVAYATPAAIGSGSDVALGLLRAGWAPTLVVEAVADVVTSVGGKVREIAPEARKAKARPKRGSKSPGKARSRGNR